MTEFSSSQVDAVQVRRFLEVVHGAGSGRGELVLYAQRGQGGRYLERRQAGVDLDPTGDLRVPEGNAASEAFGLGELVREGWDVYVTPCRFKTERVRNTRRQADVCWVPGVWADLDVKGGVEGAIQDGLEMTRVLEALPRPTLLVDSGSGGRHAYWLLTEGSEDPRRMRRLGYCWLQLLGEIASQVLGRPIQLDRVWDLSRVFRLAGTWRQPGKTARDGITEPRPVVILEEGPRWSAEELEGRLGREVTEQYDRQGARTAARGLDVDPADPRVDRYVQSVLEDERDALRDLEPGVEGGRNTRLNRAAFVLGTLGAHGILDRDRARGELLEACRACGLLADDGEGACESTFDSGWDAGLGNPRTLPGLGGLPPDGLVDVWPTPQEPLEVARRLLRSWAFRERQPLVRYWRGDWMRRRETGVWEEVEEMAVVKAIYDTLGSASYQQLDQASGEVRLVPWNPNIGRTENVLRALKTSCLLDQRAEPSCWLGTGLRDWTPADRLLVCRNGILDLRSRVRGEHDPRLFTLVSVPFDYDGRAARPEEWFRFLNQLWRDDPQQIACLQEIFGYVLSGRTDLQKIPLIAGPPRSGKGTIARVLTQLVGLRNVVGVSLASLQNNFGLEPLLDKPLAVISDARLDGGGTDQLVERLLSISGEDTVTVDRKYKSSWTGKLPTRFLVLSNELPRLRDNSGAVARRFVTLQLTRSWSGHENLELLDELLRELPGILNWSLDGLDQLDKIGRFTEGEQSQEARATMEEAGSPILAFLRGYCEKGEEFEVEKSELYRAWTLRTEPRYVRGEAWFTRDLKAAAPEVFTFRRRFDGLDQRFYGGIRLLP